MIGMLTGIKRWAVVLPVVLMGIGAGAQILSLNGGPTGITLEASEGCVGIALAKEGHPAREALVEHETERVEVGPPVELLAADLGEEARAGGGEAGGHIAHRHRPAEAGAEGAGGDGADLRVAGVPVAGGHSIEDDETNSNFGFNLSWWDRLFGTYRDQPRAGHENMVIGIPIACFYIIPYFARYTS